MKSRGSPSRLSAGRRVNGHLILFLGHEADLDRFTKLDISTVPNGIVELVRGYMSQFINTVDRK